MSEDINPDDASIQQLFNLNHEISHNLQKIMLVLAGSKTLTKEQLDLLIRETDEMIRNYSHFRACSYSLLGLDD